MRPYLFSFILLIAFPSFLLAAEAPLSLEEVLNLVREKNPDIRAARGAAEGAARRVGPAGTWPNPVVGLAREKTPDGEKMGHMRLEQDVPFPGKLSKESGMKRHEARIAGAEADAKSLEVLARARALYYRLFRADRLIPLLSRNVDVMKTLLRSMEARLSTGGGGMGGASIGGDVFSMQVELGRMENMLLAEKQERVLVQIELNSLLDRPVLSPLGAAVEPELKDIPLGLDEVLALAREKHPLSQAAGHEERHAKSMLSRARLEWAPDIGLMYDRQTAEGGMRGYEAGVSLSVPLWFARPYGQYKEAKAHIGEAAAESRAMRNMVEKMAAMEYTETVTHLSLARRYKSGLLPSAESAFGLARRRYESGGGDFVRLLESLRALLSAETEYYNELYHYGEHWGLLESWVGVELTDSMKRREP